MTNNIFGLSTSIPSPAAFRPWRRSGASAVQKGPARAAHEHPEEERTELRDIDEPLLPKWWS